MGKGWFFNKWIFNKSVGQKKKKNPTKTIKKNYDSYLTPHIKIKSKWITDLKVSPQTIKLVEENIIWMFTTIKF